MSPTRAEADKFIAIINDRVEDAPYRREMCDMGRDTIYVESTRNGRVKITFVEARFMSLNDEGAGTLIALTQEARDRI